MKSNFKYLKVEYLTEGTDRTEQIGLRAPKKKWNKNQDWPI